MESRGRGSTEDEFPLFLSSRASPVTQTVKNLPTVWETWVQSLGQGDPLEKGMATHSSILAWRIHWKRSLKATVHGFSVLSDHKTINTSLFFLVIYDEDPVFR